MNQLLKRIFFFGILTLSGTLPLFAEDGHLAVVTTLSSYADIAKSIGGARVETTFVASPKFNPHFIEPRPSDVLKLKKADLFIHSGLDLEAWRTPLIDAAAKSDLREGGSRQIDLSEGIPLLEVPSGQVSRAEGDIHMFGNPHYWIDPRSGLIIAKHIAKKLSEIDPSGKYIYEANLKNFDSTLRTKMTQWQIALSQIKGKEVLGYHNEWPYMMNFAGLKMNQFVEPKPGIPPGPQHLSELEHYITANNIHALIQASYFSKEAGEYLTKNTGIKVLMLCQNVGELPECSDYISMVDFDIQAIVKAVQ